MAKKRGGSKKGFSMVCLECASEYKTHDEMLPCPECGGVGELAVSNYEDSGWGADSEFHEDEKNFDIGDLAYDPSIYTDD